MTGGRTAIVTGASSGIGRALAERAVRSGWNVLAVGRRTARLDELAARVAGATGTLATLSLDVREPHAAARVVALALERFGRLDVLVNNAGGVAVGAISEQSDAALREQTETHVVAPLALLREALPALRASRGHVFFVGSGVARVPVGLLGAYPPAKAAVRNMTRVARNELRPSGIAVTYVDPGAVATEFMTRAGFDGPPAALSASPHDVARKIFAAFATRRPVVNAVPWQTAFVALAEAFPAITDALLSRFPQIVGVAKPPTVVGASAPSPAIGASVDTSRERAPVAPVPVSVAVLEPEPGARAEAIPHAGPASVADAPVDDLATALAPLDTRMTRAKLRPAFVRELLCEADRLDAGDVAMRWAGMPNKHERALTSDVLDALAGAGFLTHADDGSYEVVRRPT